MSMVIKASRASISAAVAQFDYHCPTNLVKRKSKSMFMLIDLRIFRLYLILLLGLFAISIAAFTYFEVPKIIVNQFQSILTIANSSESRTYPAWSQGSSVLYNRIYLFNITNLDEVLSKNERPNLEQTGPYVFAERGQKVNITWNTDGTVTYRLLKTFHFVPELTNGSLDDAIYQINFPLATMLAAMRSRYSNGLAYIFANRLISMVNSELYPRHTVRELLFDGYSDNLVTTYRVLNFAFPDNRFGYFYGSNNSLSPDHLTIHTGAQDLGKLGTVANVNGRTSTADRGHCGSFEGVSAGDFVPPMHATPDSKRPDNIKVYVGAICRHLQLNFDREIDEHHLRASRYAAGRAMFDYSLEQNKCFCPNGTCPPNGFANISSCMYGAPVGISLPHFLYADDVYHQTVTGMKPDPVRHEAYADIVTEFGFPIKVSPKLQLNVVLERDVNVHILANMSQERIYFPVMWLEVDAKLELDRSTVLKLKYAQEHKLYVNAAAFLLILAGLALTVIALLCALRITNIRIPNSSETNSLTGDF